MREVLLLLAADGVMLVVGTHGVRGAAAARAQDRSDGGVEGGRLMRHRTLSKATGAFVLLVVLGVAGCESESYDVKENLSYDSTIGYRWDVRFLRTQIR